MASLVSASLANVGIGGGGSKRRSPPAVVALLPPPGSSIVRRLDRHWDVSCPPARMTVVAGQLVPNVRAAGNVLVKTKRRISIEIHGPADPDLPGGGGAVPPDRRLERGRGGRGAAVEDLGADLQDDDMLYVRILRPPRGGRWGFRRGPDHTAGSDGEEEEVEEGEEEDETTPADSMGSSSLIGGAIQMMQEELESGDWIECRRYEMVEINETKVKRNIWVATLGLGACRERRDIVFADQDQAQDFETELMKLALSVRQRGQQRLEAFKSSRVEAESRIETNAAGASLHLVGTRFLSALVVGGFHRAARVGGGGTRRSGVKLTDTSSEVALLVEIVSASDLPMTDQRSMDPNLVVFMGKQIIHKTKTIPKELNPVWTVETGSLFVASCSAEEFFSFATGLTFCIYDVDSITKDVLVGQVSVSQKDLLLMNGERVASNLKVSQKLINERNSKKLSAPKLYLRVRKATPEDKAFIEKLNSVKRQKKEGDDAPTNIEKLAPIMGRFGLAKPIALIEKSGQLIQKSGEVVHKTGDIVKKRQTKVVDGVKLHRVKPGPDPTRPEEETKWLPMSGIDEEVMKPSYSWIEAGTGRLGKIYLEILKCDDLPNTRSITGSTDPCCCIIFEDAIVKSNVIENELSPRWVPWSRRAFAFNVAHPSSQLLIGVFGYYINRTGLGSHDAIGRISVDVTNLHPDTEYLLTYNLYASHLDSNRSPRGKLTIRLRFEYDDFKKYALGTLALPPVNYINVSKNDQFLAAYFVCNGKENVNRYSMEDLTAYHAELKSLVGTRYYIIQAFLTVVFWRGHKDIKVSGRTIKLPLHSVVAFVMGTTLIENFNLYPSYCLFSIAWLLAGTNELRQRNPSPWHRSMTIAQIWYALIFDKIPPEDIADHENEAAARNYEETAQRRQEEEERIVKQRQEKAEAVEAFLQGGSTQPEEGDHETKLGGLPTVNPLAAYLLPVQQFLGKACRRVRIVQSVVMWDECYIAFLIFNICLALGIAFLWVPWSFVVRWIGRFLIWTLLGPWMALVDLYAIPYFVGDTRDKDEAFRTLARTELENLVQAKDDLLRRREDILKHQAMKRYVYGKYAVKVPQFKDFRYKDVPLPESSARSVHGSKKIKVTKKWKGQDVVVDMLPIWEDDGRKDD